MEKGDMVKLIEEKEFCLELLLSVFGFLVTAAFSKFLWDL